MDFKNGTLEEKVGFDTGGLSRYDDEQVFERDMSCRRGIVEGMTGYISQKGLIIILIAMETV